MFEKEKNDAQANIDEENRKAGNKRVPQVGKQDYGPKMKQTKFAFKIIDKQLQKRWDDALVDYAADSFSSYRQLTS